MVGSRTTRISGDQLGGSALLARCYEHIRAFVLGVWRVAERCPVARKLIFRTPIRLSKRVAILQDQLFFAPADDLVEYIFAVSISCAQGQWSSVLERYPSVYKIVAPLFGLDRVFLPCLLVN